jgi:TM2 domain-containing membrane protein YozV
MVVPLAEQSISLHLDSYWWAGLWICFFGIHRLYLGKWLTALIWFLTGGLFLVGYLYDYWTLNDQIAEANREPGSGED